MLGQQQDEGAASFDALVRSYERDGLRGTDGAAQGAGSGSFTSFSFESFSAAWGDSVKDFGQSRFVQGTPLQAIDVEAGDGTGISQDADGPSSSSLSRSERFKGFVLLLGMSAFFFLLASFFISVVLIFPGKFAFSFTMSSVCFMSAFALMKGPSNWLQSVCSGSQMPFTVAYFGSIVGTLYACLVMRSYIFVLFFSVVQICALGYYAFGNLPGGKYGLQMLARFIRQMAANVCWPCFKGIVRMFQSMFS